MKKNIIQIQNLSKRFGSTYALKDIDLTIRQGEVFGIIGMSGAGKSTLIRCLACLDRPTEGEILLSGQALVGLTSKELRPQRKKMGMIFQHFNLFSSRCVLDNISYPLEIEGVSKEQCKSRAFELLHLVGLQEKHSHFPSQLSGGEKQRVAIARALTTRPEVLLCDEATSALDPSTTHAILELLESLNKELGLTILLITHEMAVIKQICTHVAVLEHGEIVEKGTTVDLFSSPKHPTTKRFLQNMTHEIPSHFLEVGEVIRLCFTGKSASEPVISRMVKECGVDVNILLGGIDVLKSETVGNLVVSMLGSADQLSDACQFLDTQGVLWERIK